MATRIPCFFHKCDVRIFIPLQSPKVILVQYFVPPIAFIVMVKHYLYRITVIQHDHSKVTIGKSTQPQELGIIHVTNRLIIHVKILNK